MDRNLDSEGVPLWLPGERWETGLQARLGEVALPLDVPPPVLMVTTHRAILVNQQSGRSSTSLLLLANITGVELVDTTKQASRLVQGLLLLGTGILLALAMWVVLQTLLFVLIAGALPGVAGVYLLAGYLFPDQERELLLHTAGYTARMPLLTANARRDAYLVAHRISELSSGGAVPRPAPADATPPEAGDARVAPETTGEGSVDHSPAVPEGEAATAPAAEDAASPPAPNPTV